MKKTGDTMAVAGPAFSRHGMLASLDSKRIDVVINQVTISDERKKKYDFSTPYTISGVQALTLKKNAGTITKPEDLAGKKVGVGLAKTFAAEDLLAQIKNKGELRVGLEGTYPPFSFQDERGKLTGFEVEFAQELAQHLGVKAALKPTKWVQA
ncbi:hypothetical protein CRX72_20335 [Pantoea sp. BRM17]|nr:hypothetical protein CRX72_20335 [Pantoea sp. BRM17]